jgi:hypothetical protein
MKDKKEADSQKGAEKVTLFGILSATKRLTEPVNELLQVQKERLQVEKQIEKALHQNAVAQQAIAQVVVRAARAIEAIERNSRLRT